MSGIKDLIDFKLFEGKKILGAIKDKPSRLLTGVDPASTKLWNGIKGSDDDALVDEWGGTTKKNMAAMDKAGINTKPGRAMEGLAHAIAAFYAGSYGAKAAGFGGSSSATAANGSNATNPALIDSAMGSSGYGASSAGPGGGSSAGLSGQNWMDLGKQMQGMGGNRGGGQQQDIEGVDLAALAEAEAARQRENDVIAQSSKSSKTKGGGRTNPDHPIDRVGNEVAAIQELERQVGEARKRLAAIKAKRKGH